MVARFRALTSPVSSRLSPRRLRGGALALVLCTLAACWLETQVDTVRIVPGTLSLPGVSHIVLGDFAGPGGEEVAHAVAAALMQRRSFAVSDLSASRPFGAGDFGRLLPVHDSRATLGTDAGITASVVHHDVEDDLQFEEHRAPGGGSYTQYVRRGTLHVQVMFRAVDPHSGALFDAHTLSVHRPLGEEAVVMDGPAVADADYIQGLFAARDVPGLFFAGYQDIAEQFCEAVQMQQEAVSVALFHDKHDATSVRAIEAVRRGDWSMAIGIYREATDKIEADKGSAANARAIAHYNLGTAYAYSGALARGLYELAWSQAIDDTPLVREQLTRVRGWDWEARQPRRSP